MSLRVHEGVDLNTNPFSDKLPGVEHLWRLGLVPEASAPVSYLRFLAEEGGVWLNGRRSFPLFRHVLRLRGMRDDDESLVAHTPSEPSDADIEALQRTHGARLRAQGVKTNPCRARKRFILGGRAPRSGDAWRAWWREDFARLSRSAGGAC